MRFSVIGAGNGGQCIAGYLSLLGHSVKIQDKDPQVVRLLQERKSIKLEGKVTGESRPDFITSDVHEAVTGNRHHYGCYHRRCPH
jgi:opine dehydrogenase